MSSTRVGFDTVTSFNGWCADNQCNLLPPVCNAMLHQGDGSHLMIMVVGGPNQREDYHINQGEEIFYQIKGSMVLKIVECGSAKDVVIKEGEIFVLPGAVPHSPQRFADTLGLVVERARLDTELDGLRYWTDATATAPLWERWFHCTDLGSSLPPLIKEFMESSERTTRVPSVPLAEAPMPIDTTTMVKPPVPLESFFAGVKKGDWPREFGHKEFSTLLISGLSGIPTLPIETSCWIWVLEGGSVTVNGSLEVTPGACVLVRDLHSWAMTQETVKAVVIYTNAV